MEEPAPEQVAAAATYRPPRSSYGTRPPSGPAKTTTPPVSKPRSPPPPEFRPPASTYAPTLGACRQQNVVICERCNDFSATRTHHCQAFIALCQDCGQQHPVIADVSDVNPTARIPICRSLMAYLRNNLSESYKTQGVPPSSYAGHSCLKKILLARKSDAF